MTAVKWSMNDLTCRRCESVAVVKNGHAHTGKQRYLCRACGYQFTLEPQHRRISPELEAQVELLLTERLSHRGICRQTGVSRSWFRLHLKKMLNTVPQRIDEMKSIQKKPEHSKTSLTGLGVRRVMHLCATADKAPLDLARFGPAQSPNRELLYRSTRCRRCLWVMEKFTRTLPGRGLSYRPLGRV